MLPRTHAHTRTDILFTRARAHNTHIPSAGSAMVRASPSVSPAREQSRKHTEKPREFQSSSSSTRETLTAMLDGADGSRLRVGLVVLPSLLVHVRVMRVVTSSLPAALGSNAVVGSPLPTPTLKPSYTASSTCTNAHTNAPACTAQSCCAGTWGLATDLAIRCPAPLGCPPSLPHCKALGAGGRGAGWGAVGAAGWRAWAWGAWPEGRQRLLARAQERANAPRHVPEAGRRRRSGTRRCAAPSSPWRGTARA